ncbi:MAG TPA: carboxymuconolactone decarboxylase family protein [Thermoplasmata archaeon]|jgi:AhpD family alkylhydroperoxidase|nr:carboxymuconolactone decarboxylase family protein [Thermoplasmata archaeon]HIH28682.1 carboxymuconolactone decarboxylase family protein [Thermoplasmata archaeon]
MNENLDERTKELIGIAASVAGHCRKCFLYHFKQAKKLGVSQEDIQEVIEFAGSISAAGDRGMNEFILKTIKGEKEVGE